MAALLHLVDGLGPMASAFVVTALAGGSAAIRELLDRVFRWRVGVGWWVVAVLGTPIPVAMPPTAMTRVSNVSTTPRCLPAFAFLGGRMCQVTTTVKVPLFT